MKNKFLDENDEKYDKDLKERKEIKRRKELMFLKQQKDKTKQDIERKKLDEFMMGGRMKQT